MKVVLVTHYFPTHGGGIELVAQQLARRLAADHGCEIDWFASGTDAPPSLPGITAVPMRTNNLVERLTGMPYPIWGPGSLRRLARAIRDADAVHIHDCIYFGSLCAALLARLYGKRLVVTQHVGEVPAGNPLLRLALAAGQRVGAHLALARADAVVFISLVVKRFFEGLVGERPTFAFVPNGVDLELFKPGTDSPAALREQLGFEAERPLLLFVGRFVPKKRLSVIRALADANPDWQWCVIGSGPEDPAGWELPNVTVRPPCAQGTLVRYYQAADLLVLPSVGEGFPLVVQEAMACGLMTVISAEVAEAGAIPDDAYVCIQPSNDALADNRRVIAAALVASMAGHSDRRHACIDHARARWNWAASAGRHALCLSAPHCDSEFVASGTARSAQTLLGGAVLIAALAAVVGLFRLGQDVLIAWRFGTAPAIDAFYFVANLVAWPVTIALSTFTLLIAPAEAALRMASTTALNAFRGELLGWTLAACLLALPVSYVGLQILVSSPLAAPVTEIAAQAAEGASVAFAAVAFGLLSAIATAWFVSSNLRATTLLDALTPISIIFTAALLPSAAALYWGLTAGAAAQAAVALGLLALRNELPRPRLTMHSSGWRGMARAGMAFLAVQIAFTALPVIDQLFAVHLGAGAVASLNYANRLLIGVLAVAALGVQRAALPLLADWMVRDHRRARRFVNTWVLRILLAGLPLTGALWLMAPFVVDALYTRGSFSEVDALTVAHLFQVGSLQLPLYLAGTLLVAALAAMGSSLWVTIAGLAGLTIKCGLNALLVDSLGATGLQLATVGMFATTLACAWLAVARSPLPAASHREESMSQ